MFCLESRTTTTIHCVCFALSLSLSPAPRSGSLEAWILSLSQELHLRDPRESITHTKNKNQPNPTYADLLPCRSSYKDNFNFKAASSKEVVVTLAPSPEPWPWPSRQPRRPLGQSRPLLRRLALDLVASHLKWFPLAVLGGAPVPPPPLAAAGAELVPLPLHPFSAPRGRGVGLHCFFS